MSSVKRIFASIPSNLAKLPPSDHRLIGLRQKLFFISELSPGSCFFMPRGAHIYNKLVDYLRGEYKRRNYEEVITPNIFDCQLWKSSGHWEYYQKNMIKFPLNNREFSLKPMNCPAHCLMYKQLAPPTPDELPIRWADFGALHRNELSGALLGLSRVRRFQQDDAHIFCTPQQVELEVKDCLEFARQVYGEFGFDFEVRLSTRPQTYMGEATMWDKAEESLRAALKGAAISFEEQKFEGAFYGPKIDLVVRDCLNRSQQCATIQLDFQLPERFDLTYKIPRQGLEPTIEPETVTRPVIIHRAILGSIERFIGMIAENCAGRWPFWLSPLQAMVIPVHPNQSRFAKQVSDEFKRNGFWVDCSLSNERFANKIRTALLKPYSVILIVGQREVDTRSVTIRIESANETKERSASADEDEDEDDQAIRNDSSSDNREKKVVNNINMSVEKLMELFKEFEKCRVNRANLELLKLFKAADGGGQ